MFISKQGIPIKNNKVQNYDILWQLYNVLSKKCVKKKCSLCTLLLLPRNHFILDVECSLEIICSLKNQMSDGLR